MTFNPGIRGNIALGYNINRSWAAEFDTGVIWNSIDSFDGTSLSSVGASFDTYTIPLLVNVVYRIPIKGPWSSYLGAGAGGAASLLSYSQTYLGTRYSWNNSTFVFGYQAKAGLQYQLNRMPRLTSPMNSSAQLTQAGVPLKTSAHPPIISSRKKVFIPTPWSSALPGRSNPALNQIAPPRPDS